MQIYLTIPALVAVIGVVVYGITQGKASEIGRIAFAFGLLVTLMHLR